MLSEEDLAKVDFVINCVKGLDEIDYKIIVGLYLEKCSIKTIQRNTFMSKSNIYYRKNVIIGRISSLSMKS